jgi:hypothetical protein
VNATRYIYFSQEGDDKIEDGESEEDDLQENIRQ